MLVIRPRSSRLVAATALAAAPLTLAYRFALLYRARAGYPRRVPPVFDPADVGLPFERVSIDSPGGRLPGWFIPSRQGGISPAIVLVHGWESNRSRLLPNVQFLAAVGFHCLLFDVRGHGENGPELLPISGAEFGEDTASAVRYLRTRRDTSKIALLGHSMGGVGAAIAAAAEPTVDALVCVSSPADPRLMTRETFRIAHLPIPAPVAHPLAWLTSRVYIRPRGHSIASVSARRAISRYPGPVLLTHGSDDAIVPPRDLELLAEAARRGRPRSVETLLVEGGMHSWLYEYPEFRRVVAAFLTAALGDPSAAETAGERAASMPITRLAEPETPFSALEPAVSAGATGASTAQ